MILIVSDTFDQSTNDVIDWLATFGIPWRRFNGDSLDGDAAWSIRFDARATTWTLDSAGASLDADVVWMRRWRTWLHEPLSESFRNAEADHTVVTPLCVRLSQYRSGELRALSASILATLASKRRLGNPVKLVVNKQHVLETARDIGLSIPTSLITNSRDEARRFRDEHGAIITKPVNDVTLVPWGDDWYTSLTVRCTDEVLDALPQFFLPSLFQVEIPKALELRVFCLAGECYAMAMFTQASAGTAVDYRRYDWTKPSRCVPYALPDALAARIRELMTTLELDTGSLDLIVTPSGEPVFLEVNPVGQFGMTSAPCNYNLERRVAERLREMQRETQQGDAR